MAERNIVTEDEWRKARVALLEEEKELTRRLDELAAKRRAMPWTQCAEYIFSTTAGDRVPFSALFKDPRKPLYVYHLMFSDDDERPCKSCSFWVDTLASSLPHIEQRANVAVIAKASPDKLAAAVAAKGWPFAFYSSAGSAFNVDFDVEMTDDDVAGKGRSYNFVRPPLWSGQMPGLSVFALADGHVYRTYSAYARGLEQVNGVYGLFDLLPEGRSETSPMDWLKHREDY